MQEHTDKGRHRGTLLPSRGHKGEPTQSPVASSPDIFLENFDASAHDKTDHADRKLVNVRRHDPTTLLSAHANSTRPRSNLIDFNLNEENFHHVFTHLVRVVRRGKALRTLFFFFFLR